MSKELLRDDRELVFNHAGISPTPIWDGARQLFIQWGVTDEVIQQLQMHTGVFKGQYAQCVNKVKAIAKRPAGLSTDSDLQTHITIPHFFSGMERSYGGQCGDLADSLMANLDTAGVAETLKREKLRLCRVAGQSPTHFNQEGSHHIWCGVFPQNRSLTEVLKNNVNYQKTIILDPSRQIIATAAEAQYQIRHGWGNVAKNRRKTPRTLSMTLQINRLDCIKEAHDDFHPDKVVLGMSADDKLAYGIGFGSFFDRGNHLLFIVPYICVMPPDGISSAIFYIDPFTKTIAQHPNNPIILDDSQRDEIEQMLTIAANIQYS